MEPYQSVGAPESVSLVHSPRALHFLMYFFLSGIVDMLIVRTTLLYWQP